MTISSCSTSSHHAATLSDTPSLPGMRQGRQESLLLCGPEAGDHGQGTNAQGNRGNHCRLLDG